MKTKKMHQKQYSEQVNQKDYQYKLSFKGGYAQNQQFVRSHKQILNQLMLKTFLKEMLSQLLLGFNMWLLFIILLSIIFSGLQQMWICIIQLVFNLLMGGLRIYQQLTKAVKQIEDYYKQMVYVIQWDPRCHIQKTAKKDVTIGSLIFLKRHQPAPISVLVLNSQEERFMVQTWQKDGITHLTPKQSIKLTSTSSQDSQTFVYFKRILTGKIEFDEVDGSNRNFRGFIKLQKDPKGEYLDFGNIIQQSSIIYNTDWVVGIVISNDDDDVHKLWANLFKQTESRYEHYLKRFSMIFGLLYLLQLAFSITLIIRFMIIPDEYSIFMLIQRIFQSITFVHPSFIIGLSELVFQMLNRQFQKQTDMVLSHSSALLNLTKIDHCIYDKTGTLTNTNTILGGVICGSHYYPLKNEENLIRKETKQFKRLKTQTVNRNMMQEIEEEDEVSKKEIEQQSEVLNFGFGSLQKSEKLIPEFPRHNSIKSRLQSQHDEALSFNPEEAILNDDMDMRRNQISNINPQFKYGEESRRIHLMSPGTFEEQSMSNSPSISQEKRSPTRIQRRTLGTRQQQSEHKPKTPGFSEEVQWKDALAESVQLEEQQHESESDEEERKELRDLIRLGHKQTNEFMRALILCQDVKTKYTKNITKMAKPMGPNIGQSAAMSEHPNVNPQNFFNENSEEYQESVMKYAKLYGFEFNCAGILNKKICYEISAKGLSERYAVLKKMNNNEQFAIILEQNRQEVARQKHDKGKQKKVKLYIKSENLKLLEHCNLSQSKLINLEKTIQYLQQTGYRFVVYAGKSLDNINLIKPDDNGQIYFYGNTEQSIHSTYQSTVSTTFDKELYEKLDYYGIICLKEEYNQGALQIARQMKNLDIPQWILSGDKKMQTISTAYQVGILSKEYLIIRLDEEEEDKLKLQIKSQLLFIRKQLLKESEQHQSAQQQNIKQLFQSTTITSDAKKVLQKSKSFMIDESQIKAKKIKGEEPLQKVCLLLNAKCIKIIFQDEYMKSHFLFIALILKTVIAYDCSPLEKQIITESVNQVLQPGNTLLTISDSVDDFDMNLHAEANIQYMNPKSILKLAYANIQVNNLQYLRQLILYFAKILAMHLTSITVLSTKTSLCQVIIFTMHVCIHKALYIEENLIYLISLQLQVLSMALLCRIEDRSDKEQIELMLPQIVSQSYKCFKSNFRWLQEMFYEVIFSAGISGFLCTYVFGEFMVFSTSDYHTLPHLMYIFQSFVLIGFGISHMIQQNATIKQFFWYILIVHVLLAISLSIVIPTDIRQIILSRVFIWQFIIGLFTCIMIVSTIDQIIKQTREWLFSPRVILSFLQYIQNAILNLPFDQPEALAYDIRQFPIQTHVKISRSFFQKIKAVFNNVSIDPFIRSLFESEETQSFSEEYNRFSLIFKNKNYETQFRSQRILSYYHSKREIVLLLLMTLRVGSLLLVEQLQSGYSIILNAFWMLVMLSWIVIWVHTRIKSKKFQQKQLSNFQIYWGGIEAYGLIPLLLIIDHLLGVEVPETTDQYYHVTMGQLLYYQFLAWDIFPPPLAYPITLTTLFEISYIVRVSQFYYNLNTVSQNFQVQFILLIVLIFVLSNLSSYTHYNYQRFQRLAFLFDQALQSQQEQTNQIVKLLLPAFIYEKIEQEETQIEENQGFISIIFLEICHFDKILQSKQRQVVAFLDDIFRVFDKICLQYGVQKIETVGKTYMACSGLKASEIENNKDGLNQNRRNETTIALDLSVDFFKACQEFKYQHLNKDEKLIIKIGIHYGSVIAGVIGYHKPQFSLIGDTVNTASRVCSTGIEGKINISEEAYQRVKNTDYLFIERNVEAKGKGILTVYQAYRRKLNLKKRTSLPARLKDIPQNIRNTMAMKNFKNGTQLQHMQSTDKHSTRTQMGNARRSRVFSSKPTQNVLVRGKKKENMINTSDGQKEKGVRKQSLNGGYTSITEQNSDGQRVRAKSQTIQKVDYNNQEWEETKEDEIEIKAIEWYPENRMLGQNDHDPDNVQLQQEIQEKLPKAEHQILKYHKWLLEYTGKISNDPQIVEMFETYYTEVRGALKNILYPSTIIYCLFKTQLQLMDEDSPGGLRNYTIRMFFVLYLLILYFITNRLKKYGLHTLDLILTAGYYISAFIVIFMLSFLNEQRYLISDQAEGYLFAFSCVNQSSMKFKFMFAYLLVQQTSWFVVLLYYDYNKIMLFIVLSTIILTIVSHNNFELTLRNFNSRTAENYKKEQRDSLLTNLLPQHILTRFYQNNKIKLELSDELTHATLLFADISGFTAYSSSVTPDQVVKMLRKLMTEFDKECLQQNVYKVYTIGDCYVVLGINNMEQRNPGQEARNVLETGLEMVEIIKRVRREVNFKDLNMRIGIHTGQFYGGIIGTDIVRYDIFGVDAVIANKMESQGKAAHVMVSEDTMRLLNSHFPQEYLFIYNKDVDIPVAKKKVKSYFAYRQKQDESQAFQNQL